MIREAISTVVFGVAFEILGSNINKNRDPEASHDWVFVVINGLYGIARIIFTGYGFLQLLPHLVGRNAGLLRGQEATQGHVGRGLRYTRTGEGDDEE